MPRLGVVVLSKYNDFITPFMTSVFRNQPDWRDSLEIVIGDDGLKPATVDLYRDNGIAVQPMPKPFNFARNINLCVSLLDPSCNFLLMNDDTQFESDEYAPILNTLFRLNPSYGVIALSISKGEVGNPDQKFGFYVGEPLDIRPTDTMCFVAVAINRDAWNRVGPLDERFTGYGCEDRDWGRRAKAEGFRLGVTPRVVVSHGAGGEESNSSFRRTFGKEETFEMWKKSHEEYIKKWGDGNYA